MDNVGNSYNFRTITEQLTTSGSMTKEQLLNLKNQGYEALINLLPNNNRHAVPEERVLVEAQQIKYIHIPVDWTAPTEENYAAFVVAAQDTKDWKNPYSLRRELARKRFLFCLCN